MTDREIDAYNAACKEAWQIVQGCVAGVVEQIEYAAKHGESFEVGDIAHEVVDGALVYTRDHYVCAWGLRDSGEIDDSEVGTFDEMLARRAFYNLLNEVVGHSDVEEAVAKAEQAGEATEEVGA